MSLGLTHPLTDMSTRDLPWGIKAAVCRADTHVTFIYRLFEDPRSLNFLEPSGPVYICTGIALPFFTVHVHCLFLLHVLDAFCIKKVPVAVVA